MKWMKGMKWRKCWTDKGENTVLWPTVRNVPPIMYIWQQPLKKWILLHLTLWTSISPFSILLLTQKDSLLSAKIQLNWILLHFPNPPVRTLPKEIRLALDDFTVSYAADGWQLPLQFINNLSNLNEALNLCFSRSFSFFTKSQCSPGEVLPSRRVLYTIQKIKVEAVWRNKTIGNPDECLITVISSSAHALITPGSVNTQILMQKIW